MSETCEALARRHQLHRAELDSHAEDLRRRFANRALGDQVFRVGSDPVRKLGNRDRLIGAAQRCLQEGVVPHHVVIGIAAALAFDAPADPSAGRLQTLLRERGLNAVLLEVCGLDPVGSREAEMIRRAYAELSPAVSTDTKSSSS
jgi:mannitol-1-phosphate 5-dehydrogenase